MNWLFLALLGYLAAQLAIGVWVAPRIHTEDDYLVAGRRLGYPLTIFTIFATWFGVETCIASAGRWSGSRGPRGAPYPFLTSLGTALALYLGGAAIEALTTRPEPSVADA